MDLTNRRLLGLCLAAMLPILAHCGESDENDAGMMETPDTGGTPTVDEGMPVDEGMDVDEGTPEMVLVSIALSPDPIALEIDATETLFVTGTFDNNDIRLVTEGVSFESSDDAVATVDGAGLVTGVAVGSATVTASVGDISGAVDVTVAEAATLDVVFGDDFGPGVVFAEFGGSINDIGPTTDEAMVGTSSLRIVVPGESYTGGALTLEEGFTRDASGFDAVTFWAKADGVHTINAVGIGNDAVDASLNTEIAGGVPVTTEWAQYTIPLPDPATLAETRGLFHFAEGSDEGVYTIFLDEIRYVNLADGVVTNPRPSIATEAIERPEGGTFGVQGTTVTYAVDGTDLTLSPAGRAFFTLLSADTAIATVDDLGVVTAVSQGTTTITATLAGVAAAGVVTFTVTESLAPDVAAPTPPVRNAADVIAIFSDAYSEVTVDTFRTSWSDGRTVLNETDIGGDNVLFYENMLFAGIETTGANQLDITDMTHLHIDVWVEGASVVGQAFTIKLADWGADGAFGGGDDTDGELIFTPSGAPSPPALTTGEWQSFDIDLTDFEAGGEVDVGALGSREHLSQLILKSEIPVNTTTNLWVDNFYFYRTP